MRKNILVYNDCSNLAEMLIPLCAGEEICVQRLEIGQEKDLKAQIRRYTQMTDASSNIDRIYRVDGLVIKGKGIWSDNWESARRRKALIL